MEVRRAIVIAVDTKGKVYRGLLYYFDCSVDNGPFVEIHPEKPIEVGSVISLNLETNDYDLTSTPMTTVNYDGLQVVAITVPILLSHDFDDSTSSNYCTAWSTKLGRVVFPMEMPIVDRNGERIRPGIIYTSQVLSPAFKTSRKEWDLMKRVKSFWITQGLVPLLPVHDDRTIREYETSNPPRSLNLYILDRPQWRFIPDGDNVRNELHGVPLRPNVPIPFVPPIRSVVQRPAHIPSVPIGNCDQAHAVVVRAEKNNPQDECVILFSFKYNLLFVRSESMSASDWMFLSDESLVVCDVPLPLKKGPFGAIEAINVNLVTSDVSSMPIKFEACSPGLHTGVSKLDTSPPEVRTLMFRTTCRFDGSELVSDSLRRMNPPLYILFPSNVKKGLAELERDRNVTEYEVFVRIRTNVAYGDNTPFEYHCMFTEKDGKQGVNAYVSRCGNSMWIKIDRERRKEGRLESAVRTQPFPVVSAVPSDMASSLLRLQEEEEEKYTTMPNTFMEGSECHPDEPILDRPSQFISRCGEKSLKSCPPTTTTESTTAFRFPARKVPPKPAVGPMRDGKPPSAYKGNEVLLKQWTSECQENSMPHQNKTVDPPTKCASKDKVSVENREADLESVLKREMRDNQRTEDETHKNNNTKHGDESDQSSSLSVWSKPLEITNYSFDENSAAVTGWCVVVYTCPDYALLWQFFSVSEEERGMVLLPADSTPKKKAWLFKDIHRGDWIRVQAQGVIWEGKGRERHGIKYIASRWRDFVVRDDLKKQTKIGDLCVQQDECPRGIVCFLSFPLPSTCTPIPSSDSLVRIQSIMGPWCLMNISDYNILSQAPPYIQSITLPCLLTNKIEGNVWMKLEDMDGVWNMNQCLELASIEEKEEESEEDEF